MGDGIICLKKILNYKSICHVSITENIENKYPNKAYLFIEASLFLNLLSASKFNLLVKYSILNPLPSNCPKKYAEASIRSSKPKLRTINITKEKLKKYCG